MGATDRRQFANRTAQVVLAAFFVVVALMGAGMIAGRTWVTGLLYLAVGTLLAIRAAMSSSVGIDNGVLTTRSLARTRRHPMSGLRCARVILGRTGLAGYMREYLVVERADGKTLRFRELNSKPGEDSVVRRAAAAINECLAGSEFSDGSS